MLSAKPVSPDSYSSARLARLAEGAGRERPVSRLLSKNPWAKVGAIQRMRDAVHLYPVSSIKSTVATTRNSHGTS